MALENKTILVIGATGLLGQPVVHALDHIGFPIRIFSRSTEKAQAIFGKYFSVYEGDIFNADSLKRALDGCFGVHINLKGGPKPRDFNRIEYQGTKAIVDTAKEMDVERITLISGATVSEERCWFPMIKVKYDAEQAIINSRLKYSIFRATWFMESLPLFVRGNQATVMGKQPHKIHWLAADDYAAMVVRSYLLDEAADKIFTVFGPEEYTFNEALQIFCRIARPEAKVTNVPLGVLSFFAAITFSKQLKEALPLMKYFEKQGELGNPSEADNLLGAPHTTLEQWSRNYKQFASSK
jgi:uncharacterized protein YbjT (DUF2867 family)